MTEPPPPPKPLAKASPWPFVGMIGMACVAFLIGANSLGSLIFPGIALNNQPQLILGAACTALLALLLDSLVILVSRRWLERGLRPA